MSFFQSLLAFLKRLQSRPEVQAAVENAVSKAVAHAPAPVQGVVALGESAALENLNKNLPGSGS